MNQGLLFTGFPSRSATLGCDESGASIYRYDLLRTWRAGPTLVNFVMLNLSTADATADDPTIRRCLAFARGWGFGGIVVTNLYALRATDPRELWGHPHPIGPENDDYLCRHAADSELVVCAWGGPGKARRRAAEVHEMLRPIAVLHCLKLTAGGQPAHPLYLRGDLRPEAWNG